MRRHLFAFAAVALAILATPTYSIGGTNLEGKIWRVSDGKFITAGQLVDDLTRARFILIGERHGRRAHQEREAFLLAALAERKRYPGVAFEMLSHTQVPVVEAYRRQSPEYAAGLGVALKWHKTNWPDWSFYAPIFDIAFSAKLPIAGADLDKKDRDNLASGTLRPLPENDPRLASWSESLKKAHCNQIDDARLADLTRLQVVRDETMARTLEEISTKENGAVLIAGSAHVRKDRSVPTYLSSRYVKSVALLETINGKSAKEHMVIFLDDNHGISCGAFWV